MTLFEKLRSALTLNQALLLDFVNSFIIKFAYICRQWWWTWCDVWWSHICRQWWWTWCDVWWSHIYVANDDEFDVTCDGTLFHNDLLFLCFLIIFVFFDILNKLQIESKKDESLTALERLVTVKGNPDACWRVSPTYIILKHDSWIQSTKTPFTTSK